MAAPPFDWNETMGQLVKLMIAYLLALPVGWYREKEAHSMGIRTFPLVAMASCGYVLMAMPDGAGHLDAQSRVIQGLVTGIGFIGGGAILKSGNNVHGTATAASIWNTGVLGAAVAQNRLGIAIMLSVMNLVALRLLLPLKQKLSGQHPSDLEPGEPK